MKRQRAWIAASAAGVTLALLLAACGGGSTYGKSAGKKQAPSTVFTYDTYTQVMVDGWDPATEYSNGIIAMSNMYETLTRYNPVTHTIDPLLATSWSHSSDGLTWTFQLRHGVHFHTGRLMTAQAAKAAILRTKQLNGGAAYIWGAVKSIDTPSQYTMVFHLSYPSPLALEASADYSAYIYDTQAAGTGSFSKWLNAPHDAGTGPYLLQTYASGQEFEVILKAFPTYWGGWKGRHFKKVVFRVVPQATTAAQLLRTGQVSFVEQMSPTLWKSLRGASGITLVSSPSWQNLLAQLNAPALSLPIRQAISYATNYPGITAALSGAAVQSSGIVPAGLFGHFSNLPNYTYDPAKAGKLLNYLTVQPLAWATQWGKGKSSSPSARQDIFMEYWWPDYADPYSWFVNLLLTEKQPFFNLSYYSNPALDKQINHIESVVATNPSAGSALYRAMQVEILKNAPIVFLYNTNYEYAMMNTFSGFQVNPAYPNVIFAYNLKP